MSKSGPKTIELEKLLERANLGEGAAFDDLILQVTERLRRLTRAMLRRYPHVRRWEETDDVFQTVLLRLHRSLKEVRPNSLAGFYGLATTQIRRDLIDLARHYYGVYGHGAKHQTAGAGHAADDAGGVIDQVSSGRQPESLEDWTAFHEAIERLPAEEKKTFELVWYGGFKQKEVAQMLAVSERTVIRQMNRARCALHELLAGDDA